MAKHFWDVNSWPPQRKVWTEYTPNPSAYDDHAGHLSGPVIVDIATDTITQPPHYNTGKIECIDYIEDSLTKEQFIGYCLGNVKKYTHRYAYKGKPEEDLKKARWYLDRAINAMETKA